MTTSLRLSFFGSSLVSSYRNGAAPYYRGIVRALAARGHRVTFYEPDVCDRQAHRDIADPPWAEVVVYRAHDEAAALAQLQRASTRSDVLVKASGIGVHDRLLEAAMPTVARPGTTTIFWDVDAPVTLERLRNDAHDPLRADLPRYDLVLTYGGGETVVRTYESLGARACTSIQGALDPDTHFPAPSDVRFRARLALLANRSADSEPRIDELFFAPARALPEYEFLLGGSGWEGFALPDNVRAVGHVPTSEHNAFNSTPLAILDVARGHTAASGSPATRVFEAAGAAACVITDAWEGIDSFFAPGREVLVAKDGLHVASMLASLSEERARTIGLNARRRALAEHTYAKRALQVESVLLVRAHAQSSYGARAWA